MKILNLTKVLMTFMLLTFISTTKAQESTEPWNDATTKKAFKQGVEGQAILWITIKGKNGEDCKIKAQKTALYCVLFKGYDPNPERNIPVGIPLASLTDYTAKIDFFKKFFEKPGAGNYSDFISETQLHPTEMSDLKIDRKTVEYNYIVYVQKKSLYEYLTDPKIKVLEPVLSTEVPAANVVVIPDDSYMDERGLVKQVDAGGYMVDCYDLVKAVKANEEIENTISTIASLLTGSGTGLDRVELAEAQNAIEKKDAINEMEDASRKIKLSASERLKNTANWDYTIKVDVSQTVDGTNRNINVKLKIVDMYTNKSEEVLPKSFNVSSSGDWKQQIQKPLSAAVEELRVKIGKLYSSRVANGIEGKVNFSISSKSKINFDEMITIGDKQVKLADQVTKVLKSLSAKGKQPKLDLEDKVAINFVNVTIPFEVTTTDDEGQPIKDKNSYQQLGTDINNKLTKQIPGLKVFTTASAGTLNVWLEKK